jgi:hypothetical protein
MVILFFLLLFSMGLNAQEHCATDELRAYYKLHIPGYSVRIRKVDSFLAETNREPALERRTTIYLPIVVHVVYNEASENISDDQIISQIEALNQDFAAQRVDPSIPLEFKDRVGESHIRFCLATLDPEGKATSGITRTYTNISDIGLRKDNSGRKLVHYTRLGGEDAWDTGKYINIWVCKMISVLGYASRPGEAPNPAEDGIVVDSRHFGTQGTVVQPNTDGRTAVHEMGHYLGLYHIWGTDSQGCGDDQIEDTPPQQGPHYGCPQYPVFSCDNNNMTMNFMDYTDDRCMYMFTKGQVDYMFNALKNMRLSLLENAGSYCGDAFKEPLSKRMTVFPTITRNHIWISQKEPGNGLIKARVFNIANRIVGEYSLISDEVMELPLGKNIPPGIYFLQLKTSSDQVTFRFIIQ